MITTLAPGLLLAMPQLMDTNFSRAVVLMLEHSDEGSFGVIINQKSQLLVKELLGSIDIPWQGDPAAPVWTGGPVMPSSGWVLHTGSKDLPPAAASLDLALDTTGSILITEGLYLTTSEDNLALLAKSPPENLRFLMGYSGWSGGQLAQEMAEGSWLHADIDIDSLFSVPSEELWGHCLTSMGINPDSIVQTWGVH